MEGAAEAVMSKTIDAIEKILKEDRHITYRQIQKLLRISASSVKLKTH